MLEDLTLFTLMELKLELELELPNALMLQMPNLEREREREDKCYKSRILMAHWVRDSEL